MVTEASWFVVTNTIISRHLADAVEATFFWMRNKMLDVGAVSVTGNPVLQ